MAFGRKKNAPDSMDERKSASEYYKLHSEAINDLVNANEENSPEVSEEELNRYRSHKAIRLSERVKVFLIKFWFYGAACFFFLWGLGAYLGTTLDQLVILGLAIGVITDLLVNNLLRFLERTPGAYSRYMMYPQRKYVNLFLNIVHAMLVLFLVFMFYTLVNAAYNALSGQTDAILLGVEPVIFGAVYLLFDQLIIGMKHMMQRIISDAKKSAKR